MGKLGLLLKVQVLGLFGINRLLHGEAKGGRIRIAAVVLGALGIAGFMGFYTYGVAHSLVLVGARDAIPVLAVAMGGLVGIGVAFLKANGQLFGFADFDAVMSMPVPTWQVVVSRIASLYGMNLVFALVLMVPMFAVYLTAAAVPAMTWVVALVVTVLAPALPMAVAVVAAYGIAALAARMRYAKVVMGVLTIVLVLGVVVASISLGGNPQMASDDMQELGRLSETLSGLVGSIYPPALWAGCALVNGDGAALGLFGLVSVVPLVVVVAVMARWFLGINAALTAGRGAHGRLDARALRARGPFWAMVGKELRLLVNTPVYLTNTAVGPLFALLAAIAVVAVGPQTIAGTFDGDLPRGVLDAIEPLMLAVMPWVLALCMSMSSTSASSVSLEGSARWIMQTIPVPSATIVSAKAAANLVLCVPASLVAAGIAAVGLHADALQAIALVVAPVAGSLFAAACGVCLDVRSPRYDWTTPYEVVKRSTSVIITLFVGMLLMIGGGAASVYAPSIGWSSAVVSLVCAMVIALVALGLLRVAGRASLRDR